ELLPRIMPQLGAATGEARVACAYALQNYANAVAQLLQEREENSRLRQQQRDQAERERRLSERLRQLSEQQQALAQDKTRTVDSVGRDGKIKALQVRSRAPAPDYRARAQLAVGCVALRARQCRA
ncbi:MAG: hypothetical protein ACPIOQ_07595, partial [Promethearchaeia archaeon]